MESTTTTQLNGPPKDLFSSLDHHQKIAISIVGFSVVILVWYPWLILVILLGFLLGFGAVHYFDMYAERVDKLVTKFLGSQVDSTKRKRRRPFLRKSPSFSTSLGVTESDPLNVGVTLEEKDNKPSALDHGHSRLQSQTDKLPQSSGLNEVKLSSATSVCTSSPNFIPQPYHMPRIEDLSLKIDYRLNSSISRFVSIVFDYYVGSDVWAPYSTRRQLKLDFKLLLTRLGERINFSVDHHPDFVVNLSRRTLIPLLLHYLLQIQSNVGGEDGAELIFPEDKQHKAKLKIRRLCKTILLHCIEREDDRNCKLWVELCVAVLADGVFWNLFTLGRDQIPELLIQFANERTEIIRQSNSPVEVQTNTSDIQIQESGTGIDEVDQDRTKVPFLLDTFLDPKDSLEQPDPIVSRWKPSFKEVVEETDMLYPLIQYLKSVGGQKALAFLQAVLDDAADARDYCRRILEVEYLTGFCRSNYFHESMGLSRVDQGTDVVTEASPSLNRRGGKGHTRSSSYGSKSNQALSDILRNDGVVEGLPLYYVQNSEVDYNSTASMSGFGSSSTLSSLETEADSIFRRKPPLEDFVAKFLKAASSQKPVTINASDSSIGSSKSVEGSPTRNRRGVEPKSYMFWADTEVTSRININAAHCNVLEVLSQILSASSGKTWTVPIISSWFEFLQPYIDPAFQLKLEELLQEFLTLDLFVYCVDLITDAFNDNFNASDTDSTINKDIPYRHKNEDKDKETTTVNSETSGESSKSTGPNCFNSSFSKFSSSESESALHKLLLHFLSILSSQMIDVDKLLNNLRINRDYIFLFFVDILDALVDELFGNSCDIDC